MRYERLAGIYGLLEEAAVSRAERAAADFTAAEKEAERLWSACASIPLGMRALLLSNAARAAQEREERANELRPVLEKARSEVLSVRRMSRGINMLKEKEELLLKRALLKKEGDEIDDCVCARFCFGQSRGKKD